MRQSVYTLHPKDEEGIRKALFYELLEKEHPRLLGYLWGYVFKYLPCHSLEVRGLKNLHLMVE